MCAIPLPPCRPEEVAQRLRDEFQVEVPVGERLGQPMVRVSIQAYTHPEHIERLVEALRQIL
jgi:selenocysteine lyase/cysteine desulfurase